MKTQRENSPRSPGKRPQKNTALPHVALGLSAASPAGEPVSAVSGSPSAALCPPAGRLHGDVSRWPVTGSLGPRAVPPGGHEARKGLRETWIVKPDEASTACWKVASLDFT